ncbi:hypothetical protein OQJ46_11565 [Microbulbifer thermotolerans]|uniref:DUF2721 domain-containing protein n=1 Tax=Microbulbifer thermotolerans TaxID=252514 RepID=A0AB35I0R4_MICTH|nr:MULTISPECIES: hypothetical protein [Microbulbifer]MCX2783623.1 hypothetical protein [Microbulbifer thermotolerans]MCX2803394.1 hypothetical protein [Microbulbifer thermotolerans]MCX2836163.1 hypothetical protein [Microbulbifer thermotolerans]MCX2842080.1 hypothetical protein [Microbulbifer thermotolerans]WKT60337.1 hypothetical protein Q2E61_15715 [Microbulbifer thermotolerans]
MSIVEYHVAFRTALFLSSLTLGTFLFTMKTFIIQTIKKEIYDHERHKALARNVASDSGNNPMYYRGLRNLSRLIFWSIAIALLNAFFQISIGYIEHPAASIFCLLTSAASWALLAFVLYEVGGNMTSMIDYAEEDAQEEEVEDPESIR